MTTSTRYRIEVRGRLSDDILGPYVYDFVISRTTKKTTLAGLVRDPAHLHGIITHLTSQGIHILAINTDDPPTSATGS